jgi:hypothetical protein
LIQRVTSTDLDSENGIQETAGSHVGSGPGLLKWMAKSNVAIYRVTDARVVA